MSWGVVAGVAGAVGGSLISSRSASKATDAAVDASNAEIAFSRETRDLIRSDQEPYRKAGSKALDALMSMTGLGGPVSGSSSTASEPAGIPQVHVNDYLRGLGSGFGGMRLFHRAQGGPVGRAVQYNTNEIGPENYYSGGAITRAPNPRTISPSRDGYIQPHSRLDGGNVRPDDVPISGAYPNENPGGIEGGFNFKTDPGYAFRFQEGMRALDRGAGAAGGLLSGGYGRRAIRYGQDFASNEYTNVYNRIANIAGLGQVANTTNANAGLAISGQVGGALQNQGYARAAGATAQGNAWGTAINQLGQIDWGSVFGNSNSGRSGTGGGIGPKGT